MAEPTPGSGLQGLVSFPTYLSVGGDPIKSIRDLRNPPCGCRPGARRPRAPRRRDTRRGRSTSYMTSKATKVTNARRVGCSACDLQPAQTIDLPDRARGSVSRGRGTIWNELRMSRDTQHARLALGRHRARRWSGCCCHCSCGRGPIWVRAGPVAGNATRVEVAGLDQGPTAGDVETEVAEVVRGLRELSESIPSGKEHL